jgi:mono/diheme cytochrome c family protein
MKKLLYFSLFLLLSSVALSAAPPAEEGKTIFSTRCASCHNLNKVLTGPALAGVHERRSIEWIISFVKSSQTVIKSGDQYANALFTKFNKIPMPDHADLTADHIKSIVEYIKTAPPVAADKPPFAKPTQLRPSYLPLSIRGNAGFFISYLGIVVLIVLAMVAWVYVKELERKRG